MVYANDFVDLFNAFDGFVGQWFCAGAVELPGERGIQGVIDERAFARARYASDAYKDAQWNIDIDVLQVVSAGASD